MGRIRFSELPSNEKVNTVALGISGIVVVAALAIGFFRTNSYESEHASFASQYDSLQKEYDAIQDKSVTVEEAVVILNSAKDSGVAVADIQNAMTVDYKLVGTDDEQVYIDEAESLTEYLSYATAQKIWYLSTYLDDYSWEFNTMYSFTSSTIPVLWTCYGTIPSDNAYESDTTALLAYATGTYVVEDNIFKDVSLHTTGLGSANRFAPVSSDKTQGEE